MVSIVKEATCSSSRREDISVVVSEGGRDRREKKPRRDAGAEMQRD